MTIDFKIVKKQLERILPDHTNLNEFYSEPNPTAEFLAQKLFGELSGLLSELNNPAAILMEVTVWESPECCITYSEPTVVDCVVGE
jgi:6-pyruvoyl-tetrahydropterin synthase